MPGSWSDYLELRRGTAPPHSNEDGDVRVYADPSGDLRSVQSDGTDAPIGGSGGTPAGDDQQVQFNDNGDFGASADFVFDGSNPNQPILGLAANPNGNAQIVGIGVGTEVSVVGADGDATHVGGELQLLSGGSDGQSGGDILIRAGSDTADGNGGNITIASGLSGAGDGGEIAIRANPGGAVGGNGGQIVIAAGDGDSGGSAIIQAGQPDGNVQVYSGDGNQYVQLDNSGLQIGATAVGFFQGAPVAQPALPVTLQDVIDALVALGLVAAT